jgi:hypothetical protein
MKVNTNLKEVVTEIDNVVNFGVELTPEMFKILYSGLYSNKIRAIIRELSCNAWDSHVEANTKDKQFEVKLPSALDNQFWIRDYGTGLSEENMIQIYSSFGTSTKKTSNDLIGCLGIGSKSPFSYTDNFIVTSFYNRKEYIYTCFINSSGVPSIVKIHEQETSEENGVKVQFSANKNDIYSFLDETKYVYSTFLEGFPKVIHPDFKEEFIKADLTHVCENFYIDFSDRNWRHRNKFSLIQGNISYEIPYELSPVLKNYGNFNFEYGKLYIKANIGDFTFTSSRESLDVTPSNKQKMIEICEAIDKNFQDRLHFLFYEQLKNIDNEFDFWKIKNGYDKTRKLNLFNRELLMDFCLEKGWESHNYSIKIPECLKHAIQKSSSKDFLVFKTNPEKYQFFLVDELRGWKGKVAFNKDKQFETVIIDGILGNTDTEVLEFLEKIKQFPNVSYTSTLPVKPKASKNFDKAWFSKVDRSLYSVGNKVPLHKTGIDTTAPFYLIPIHGGDNLVNGDNCFVFDGNQFVKLFESVSVIDANIPIITVPRRYFDNTIKRFSNAIDIMQKVRDYVKTNYTEEMIDNVFTNSKGTELVYQTNFLGPFFSKFPNAPMATKFKKYVNNRDLPSFISEFLYSIGGDKQKLYEIVSDKKEIKDVVNVSKLIYDYYQEHYPLIILSLNYRGNLGNWDNEALINNIQTLIESK